MQTNTNRILYTDSHCSIHYEYISYINIGPLKGCLALTPFSESVKAK